MCVCVSAPLNSTKFSNQRRLLLRGLADLLPIIRHVCSLNIIIISSMRRMFAICVHLISLNSIKTNLKNIEFIFPHVTFDIYALCLPSPSRSLFHGIVKRATESDTEKNSSNKWINIQHHKMIDLFYEYRSICLWRQNGLEKSATLKQSHTHFDCAISIQMRSVITVPNEIQFIFFSLFLLFSVSILRFTSKEANTNILLKLNQYIHDSTSKHFIVDNFHS